jgi:hypothetical protein
VHHLGISVCQRHPERRTQRLGQHANGSRTARISSATAEAAPAVVGCGSGVDPRNPGRSGVNRVRHGASATGPARAAVALVPAPSSSTATGSAFDPVDPVGQGAAISELECSVPGLLASGSPSILGLLPAAATHPRS